MDEAVSTSGNIYIVGIGDDGIDGLTSQSTRILGDADVVVGSPDVLNHVAKVAAEKTPVGGDLAEIVETIQQNQGRKIVLLFSGDPLFYGVSKFLCDKLGKEHFHVIPHVSSMQLAFARIKESWDDAHLSNLANQSIDQVIQAA